ncbi:MAG TPA: hypothetical protein VM370_06605 [Candidatus Thermoplasmatota archaeon]|nr:hypothetical protein [Candidatus Thermoplasmatota archaeon]
MGFLTGLGFYFLVVVIPFALAPALAALWATRRGGSWRFLPALAYGAAAIWTGLEATPLDRPWMPTVFLVTAILWLPATPRPFSNEGRAWLSFCASFAALSVVMVEVFRYDRTYCGLV